MKGEERVLCRDFVGVGVSEFAGDVGGDCWLLRVRRWAGVGVVGAAGECDFAAWLLRVCR